MKQKKYAAIDLGTNTFHLLIVEPKADGGFQEIERIRKHVFIAEEGIATIGKAPYQRGQEALLTFKEALDRNEVDSYIIKGTAALRTASNGPAFVDEVKAKTGIEIEIITGDEEASLIYKGVRQSIPFGSKPVMIMDIGGGSVEYIIGNQEEILWAQSFPIGATVLYNKFHKNDPILPTEIDAVFGYMNDLLQPLIKAYQQHQPTTLIGASGTFDVLEYILPILKKYPHAAEVDIAPFDDLYKRLIHSTEQERESMSDIPTHRSKLIVVAILLVEWTLKNTPTAAHAISNFAMKEGMIADLMQ